MTHKIFTIGSLTFDLFVRPKRQEIIEKEGKPFLAIPFGEKIRLDGVHELFGGGAANTAFGLKRLGIEKVCAVGAMGDDNCSAPILKNLTDEGIDISLIHKVDHSDTGFSVIINSKSGERTVLAYSGANKEFRDIDENIFNDCDGLYLCHMAGNSKKVFEKVRKFFIENNQKLLAWNPGKEQIEMGLDHFHDFLPAVNFLFLNKEEAEEFCGVETLKDDEKFTGARDFKELFNKFFKSGFQGILVITDGEKGAQVCDGEKIIFSPIDNTKKKIDALGAGDAFSSTFFGASLLGKDLNESIKIATLNAASVVSEYGAQPGLKSMEELQKRVDELEVLETSL